MRRLISSLIALCAVVATASPGAAADALAVPIDQSAPVILPLGAMNVMIGNPAIADVNVLDPRNAVVLARSYGITNLLVLDGRGRILMDKQVVAAADTGRVTMIQGATAGVPRLENYACAPRCERVPMPGETDADYNRYATGFTGYTSRAVEGRSSSGAAKPGP